MNKKKEFMKEFDKIKDKAELNALSNYSLENQLTDKQFKKIMKLKKEMFV